jgi:hypothetical protein
LILRRRLNLKLVDTSLIVCAAFYLDGFDPAVRRQSAFGKSTRTD